MAEPRHYLGPALTQRLSQQLVMTPQLRQAIKILQVSRAELETLVDQELTENPVLEENLEEKAESEYEVPTVDSLNGTEEFPAEREVEQVQSVGEIDWREFAENYANDLHAGSGGGPTIDEDDERRPALENILVKRTLLPDHLLWQLRLSSALTAKEQEIGALLVGNLDADGYLTISVEEMAFL